MKVGKAFYIFLLCVLLCNSVLWLSSCEIKYDEPLYAIMETPQIVIEDDEMSSMSDKIEELSDAERITHAKSAYYHEPVLEMDLIGQKEDYVVLDDQTVHELSDKMDILINGIINLSYIRNNEEYLEDAYALMDQRLVEAIRANGYYDELIHNAEKYSLNVSTHYANILEDNVVCRFVKEDGTEVIRCRSDVIFRSIADPEKAFFAEYPYIIYGDTETELWVYFEKVDEEYCVVGYEMMYINPDQLFLFYPEIVGEKQIGNSYRPVNMTHNYTVTGEYILTAQEHDEIQQVLQSYFDNYLCFSDNDLVDSSIHHAPYLVSLREVNDGIISSNATMEYRLSGKAEDGLSHRVQYVYENENPDSQALCVTIDFLGNFQCEAGEFPIFREGIWEYRMQCIVKDTANGYVIDDTALATISEGALDIDFYAESLDQG